MNTRRTIACILMYPEGITQQRILEGLQTQCECYNYNLAVFAPMVERGLYYKDYLHAERNILNLPDFRRFDAVILAATTLSNSNSYSEVHELAEKIRAQSDIPIITLDYDMDGCYSVHTYDSDSFYHITKHLIEEHDCRRIYILTGFKDNHISESRVNGYKKAMKEYRIPVPERNVIYGDFWYTSGEELADKIAAGEIEMPEAIVCASDHPAIGLANRLMAHGIKVPEQIIVTGYDSTSESVMSKVSITSYIPPTSRMAAEAVNTVRMLIEPELPVCDAGISDNSGLMIGESCGCRPNTTMQKQVLERVVYRVNRNYGDESIHNASNLSTLLENFMLENLAKAETPLECLKLIISYAYLLEPYEDFYLCLKPDWLDTEHSLSLGYPDRMRCVMHAIPPRSERYSDDLIHCRNEARDDFDTSLALPALWEQTEKPSVYYFLPCHFSDNTLGYAVYRCNLERKAQISISFQVWLRNVNTALEMARTRNQLIGSFLIDSMTKLNNRRGMIMRINDLMRVREAGDKLLSIVIDMDGLKHINDTYGHNEGDSAIITVASVVRLITGEGESSCRAGGDEFYILGVGKYTEEMVEEKIRLFSTILEQQDRQSTKPYHVNASVGYNIIDIVEDINISEAIAEADSKMYITKAKRKQAKSAE